MSILMSSMEFIPFPKIARFSREVIVTEKIDGTNASVWIDEGEVLAGSRTRWITPEDDNFGFAAWVERHREELLGLGNGQHFGEWWGRGIQRGYGLGERRFSLFNVARWGAERPACCHVVPELWRGNMDELPVRLIMDDLAARGSVAAPGFKKPEGIVVFHVAGGVGFKKTFEKDAELKGQQARAP